MKHRAPVFSVDSGRPERVAFGNLTTAKWAGGFFSRKAVAVAVIYRSLHASPQVGKSASRQVGEPRTHLRASRSGGQGRELDSVSPERFDGIDAPGA